MPRFEEGDIVVLARTGYGIAPRFAGMNGRISRIDRNDPTHGTIYVVHLDNGPGFYTPERFLEPASGYERTGNAVLDKIKHMWSRQNYVKLRGASCVS